LVALCAFQSSMLRYALVAALGGFAFAQNPTFHARAPLVVVPVSVSSKKHVSIDGLTASDFVLLDNGVRQTVQVDPAGVYQSSVSLVVVVETSLVSHAALLKVKKTGSMIDGYITGADGEAALITAGSDVKLRQDFTSDGVHIRNAFEQLHAGDSDQGRMLDASLKGIELLAARAADRRRILLLVGESKDRGSKTTLQEVLAGAQRANVLIYALTYSAYVTPFTTKSSDLGPPPDAGVNPLAELSRLAKRNMAQALTVATGGRQLSFQTLHAFENDLTSIGKEIHSQYLLSFTPPAEPSPSYHSLEVSVNGHPEAVVRARPGYWTSGTR
jgi:VWFA-related protein